MNARTNIPEQLVHNRLLLSLVEILREIPIGFAQVILQPSHLVGLAFLVGVFWNSWVIASVGVVGCIAGILTAFALDFPKEERRNGLYGFNGALVGLGCSYYYEVSLSLIIFVIIGGIASSIVMNRMLRIGLKPFTFPFVAVTWLIFAALSGTEWATAASDSDSVQQGIVAVNSLLRGVGQVLFQESLLTGAIFLLAIATRDWTQGIYAVLAASLGLIGASALDFPADAINLGLFGYNGVLCAVLFAGPRIGDFASAIAAIALSIAMVRLFHTVDLPAFTFPFVLSSWIVLWMRGRVSAWVART